MAPISRAMLGTQDDLKILGEGGGDSSGSICPEESPGMGQDCRDKEQSWGEILGMRGGWKGTETHQHQDRGTRQQRCPQNPGGVWKTQHSHSVLCPKTPLGSGKERVNGTHTRAATHATSLSGDESSSAFIPSPVTPHSTALFLPAPPEAVSLGSVGSQGTICPFIPVASW